MVDFTCVHCGSDNIQIVRGIFESGTEAKYKQTKDYTQLPTIGELLASDNKEVVITSQTRLAERLGNISLDNLIKYNTNYTNLEDFRDKNLLSKLEQLQKEINKKEIELNKQKEPNPPKEKAELPKKPMANEEIIGQLFAILLFLIIATILSTFFFNLFTAVLSFFLFVISLLSLYDLMKESFNIKSKRKVYKKQLRDYKEYNKRIERETRDYKENYNEWSNIINKLEHELSSLKKQKEEVNKKYQEEKKYKIDAYNEKIQATNQIKEKVWSNLFYCHRCDTVQDLDKNVFDRPENIDALITKLHEQEKL